MIDIRFLDNMLDNLNLITAKSLTLLGVDKEIINWFSRNIGELDPELLNYATDSDDERLLLLKDLYLHNTYSINRNSLIVTDPYDEEVEQYKYRDSKLVEHWVGGKGYTEYHYDDGGNLSREVFHKSNDSLEITTEYEDITSDKVIRRYMVRTYDNLSDVIEIKVYCKKTKKLLREVTRKNDTIMSYTNYKYKEVSETIIDTDYMGNTVKTVEQKLYKVSTKSNGKIIRKWFNKDGNPTTIKTDDSGFKEKYEYDHKGNLITVINSFGEVTTTFKHECIDNIYRYWKNDKLLLIIPLTKPESTDESN